MLSPVIFNRDTSLTWAELTGVWIDDTGTWSSSDGGDESPTVLLCNPSNNEVVQYDLNTATDDGVDIPWRIETKRYTTGDRFFRVDRVQALIKGTDVLLEYSLDGGNTWMEYGTFSNTAGFTVKSLHQQFVAQDVMWAFSADGGGFGIQWFGFRYREESQWAGG